MTAAEFTSLLTDDSLAKMSETDLETTLKQFPYCQPLRFALLKKYFQLHHPQKEEHLKLAATYASDRSYLYHLLNGQSSTPEPAQIEAEGTIDSSPESGSPEPAFVIPELSSEEPNC